MKILILTGKFGMGHWAAAQSLHQRIERAFPAMRVEIRDFYEYAMPDGSESLYKAFSLLVTRGSGLYNAFYKLTEDQRADSASPLAALFQEQMLRLLDEAAPDVVISTHPFCSQVVSHCKGEGLRIPLITCITDLSSHSEWISPGTDCYLVGSTLIKDRLVEKGVRAQCVYVAGIPVREEFRPRSRRSQSGVRHLLIMGGGLGLMPKKDRFYEMLNALPGVKSTIITGHNHALFARLLGRYENIEVVGFTDRVYDYMARSDLILTKPGGITLFETIFSELPILAWAPFLQQEINNADFLLKAGIGRTAGRKTDQCLAAIGALIYDDEALARMAANMKALKGQLQTESLSHILSILATQKETA